MRKKTLGRTDIQKRLEEGYYFRVKKVGKYKYITARKGQREESLGPYNGELWSLISETENEYDVTKYEKEPSAIREPTSTDGENKAEFLRRVTMARDRYRRLLSFERSCLMSEDCTHVVDGFCQFWTWDEEPLFYNFMKQIYRPEAVLTKTVLRDGVEKLVFRADNEYCRNCPAYRKS